LDTCYAGNSHAGGRDEAAHFANIIAYYSERWDQLVVEAVKYGHGASPGRSSKASAGAPMPMATGRSP
jgi:hypothetical protein